MKNEFILNDKKLEGVNKINTAQWGKLYRMMFLLEGMSKKEGINKLDKYFKNIRDKKLNRELANAFYFIKIGDEKFQEYFVRVSTKLWSPITNALTSMLSIFFFINSTLSVFASPSM